jgi:hypothetical protein
MDVRYIIPREPVMALKTVAWRYLQIINAAELPFSEQEILFCIRHLMPLRAQRVEPRHIMQHIINMASTPLAARLLPDTQSFIDRVSQLDPAQLYKLLDMTEREAFASLWASEKASTS